MLSQLTSEKCNVEKRLFEAKHQVKVTKFKSYLKITKSYCYFYTCVQIMKEKLKEFKEDFIH